MNPQDNTQSRFQSDLDTKNWANIKDEYLLQPIYGGEGRVLIVQDEYKSRYDCATCNGKGHTGQICPYCVGTGYRKGKEANGECPDCTLNNVGWSGNEGKVTRGKVLCPSCKGQGGTIIIPDESKTKTTMGNIIAISDTGIRCVKIGDKVQYTNYTGVSYNFMKIDLVVACEKDLLCIVKKLKSNVDQITEKPMSEEENLVGPRR